MLDRLHRFGITLYISGEAKSISPLYSRGNSNNSNGIKDKIVMREIYKGKEVPLSREGTWSRIYTCIVANFVSCVGVTCPNCIYYTIDEAVDYLLYKGWITKVQAMELTLSGNIADVGGIIKDIVANKG